MAVTKQKKLKRRPVNALKEGNKQAHAATPGKQSTKPRPPPGGPRKRANDSANAKVPNDLPNTYRFAAEALELMSERGGSAGSIVVSKYKNYNFKHIYALVMNTVKNIKMVKKIIHETKLAKKVNEENPFILEVLVGDLLFGKGLKQLEQNTVAAAIINLKNVILKQQEALKKTHSADTDSSDDAKYLRINHLKSNSTHLLSQLKSVGLVQVDYSKEKIKFKKFINKFKNMDANQFMVDFHFPNDLIVVKPSGCARLKRTDLLSKHKAMLQDKASFMAVEALDVQPCQSILDACCAPGSKTSLIASKMRNKGKIFAFDVDKKRLLNTIHLLKSYGVTCATSQVQDFSKVKLGRLLKSNKLSHFDSILIDPSCSGSGIRSRVDYKSTTAEAGRLKKLQAFQVSLLKHALKSRSAKTIVYCTCSMNPEENEQVVEMAMNESGVKSSWSVVDVLPYWPHRGLCDYEFGEKCIRSDANELTNGFFIAKLVCNEMCEPVASEADGQKSAKKRGTREFEKGTSGGENSPQEDSDEQEGIDSCDEVSSDDFDSAIDDEEEMEDEDAEREQ